MAKKRKKERVYLDYASGAPLSTAAARAYARAAKAFGNPSSPHDEGLAARALLEEARRAIARLTEVKSDDVIFTSGGTEANNLAILGLARRGAHFLYLPSAHASVIESMRAAEARGVQIEPLKIENGGVDIEALKTQLRKETVLVSLDAVCSETGTVWNTREVKNTLPPNVYLHVDASQAPLSEKITRSHFGADLLTFDSQKVGGARGIGCLIAPRTILLTPILFGGGQERGLRSGTESPALASAFAEVLMRVGRERAAFLAKAARARSDLVARITRAIKDVYINEGREVAPSILNLSLPGRDTDYLVMLLNKAGFAVGTKSACESDSSEGSRAVLALTADPSRAASSIRISWGSATKPAELARFADALASAVAFIDKHAAKSHD